MWVSLQFMLNLIPTHQHKRQSTLLIWFVCWLTTIQPRIIIEIDLTDYAVWYSGVKPAWWRTWCFWLTCPWWKTQRTSRQLPWLCLVKNYAIFSKRQVLMRVWSAASQNMIFLKQTVTGLFTQCRFVAVYIGLTSFLLRLTRQQWTVTRGRCMAADG
jgi:hypothetical protein